jgi:N-acetylmuramoyl-L-alanine amidase
MLTNQPAASGRGAAIVLAVLVLSACSARTSGSGIEELDLAHARSIADGQAVLPPRAEALATAERVEGRAVREGAGVRAVALHATAARTFERVWRVEGREEDAQRAIALYRAASRDVGAAGACEAAAAGARLAGDLSHDPTAMYVQMHRVLRRFAPPRQPAAAPAPSCRRLVQDALALLVAFRPSDGVLEVVDEALARDEVIAAAAAPFTDSGAPSGLDAPRAAVGPSPPSVGAAAADPPQVMRVESWAGRDAARVVVVLDRPAGYRVADEVPAGPSDPRIVLDLDGIELGSSPDDIPSQGIIKAIRTEVTRTGSRVRLDLDGHAWRRIFDLREPYRIVVDVARRPPGTPGAAPRTVARVILDPGHGGSDKGARGPNGTEEKDVALDIARRVAPVLTGQGIEVELTRDDDSFVSLEERTARANAFAADLFVSIHCNASEGRARRGLETYILDTSRDEIALRVAARENATTQTAGGELASILGDMRIADGARRSRRLAQLLLRAASTSLQAKYGDVVDGGVHAAGFYVLVGARMPAVLFETSYISNATDERRLASVEYRQLLADAIANAVRAYREGR